MSVLVELARSAEPPTSCGTRLAAHWIAMPDALRVAIPFGSASNRGTSSSKPAGISPRWMVSNSAALSGCSERYAS